MMKCYRLSFEDAHAQSAADLSFVGGRPRLPPSAQVPVCSFCGAQQAFFFQVAFPSDTVWAGRSLSVFACVSCAVPGTLIPEMLDGPLLGVDIPAGFLDTYQKNFKFLVFPTSEALVNEEYIQRVKFVRLRLDPSDNPLTLGHKIGGIPTWVLGDETPGGYAGNSEALFLLQLEQGLEFETVEGTPHQIELGLDRKPKASRRDTFRLFLGNALYLFGIEDERRPLVYAITQID
jgi:hypothetical protein